MVFIQILFVSIKKYDMDMIDCILEFEHLYRKMTEYELELLDVILTLKWNLHN